MSTNYESTFMNCSRGWNISCAWTGCPTENSKLGTIILSIPITFLVQGKDLFISSRMDSGHVTRF